MQTEGLLYNLLVAAITSLDEKKQDECGTEKSSVGGVNRYENGVL
jgi:hypothetical protein